MLVLCFFLFLIILLFFSSLYLAGKEDEFIEEYFKYNEKL